MTGVQTCALPISFIDTTGSDGVYLLHDLEPGEYTVTVQRNDFENDAEDVTVIAQEAATTQDFVLTPSLARASGHEAFAGDHEIDLFWNKPGGSGTYELYYYDDTFEAQIGCGGGCEFGVRVTPLGYPATLSDLLISVQGDAGAFNANIIAFIDPNGDVTGPDGLTPIVLISGVDLSSPDGSLTQYEVDVSEANIEVTSGDIYIMIQENNSGFMGIANDIAPQSPEYYDRNWAMVGGVYSTIFDAVGGDPSLTGDFGMQASFFGNMGRSTLNNANEDVSGATVQTVPVSVGDFANVSAEPFSEKEHFVHDQVMPFLNVSSASSRDSRDADLTGYTVYEVLDDGDSVVTIITGSDTTTSVTVPSNYAEYCYAVSALWNHLDYGAIESKKSSIACATPFLPGDINFNNIVDISDLLACVDFILEVDIPTEAEFRNADMNNDMEQIGRAHV